MRYLIFSFLSIFYIHNSIGQEVAANKNHRLLKELKIYASSIGIDTALYAINSSDSIIQERIDKILTEIHYGKTPAYMSYEGLTAIVDTNKICQWHYGSTWSKPVLTSRESKLIDLYHTHTNSDTLRMIAQVLNFERWKKRFIDKRYIVINIPAAELYIHDDSSQSTLLTMRVIVGKTENRTPCMVTTAKELVTYPYWNVPKSIAIKEMLPKIRKDINYLKNNRLQVIDSNGNIIEPSTIAWSKMNTYNFSYRFRQASGCDNALGVMKFNLLNPFDVYMHDTNQRALFNKQNRWLSHGCIRLQNPIELANFLFKYNKFPPNFLQICLKEQKPRTEKLPTTLPIFITYHTIDINHKGEIIAFSDIYNYDKPVAIKP